MSTLSFIPAFFKWSWYTARCWVEAARRLQRVEQGQLETRETVSELATKVDANAEEARKELKALRREAAVEFRGMRRDLTSWAQTIAARPPSGGSDD